MKPKIWVVVLGIVAVILLAFAGLAPLPGQKDVPTPYNEPSPPGQSPAPPPPGGPPHTIPGDTPGGPAK
jgi:hypothetical protein